MNLWERLQEAGIVKKSKPADILAECSRFRAEPAYQQYLDEAKFNIISQLWGLGVDDLEQFQALKRSQMALEGFDDFIEQAIVSEQMRQRTK